MCDYVLVFLRGKNTLWVFCSLALSLSLSQTIQVTRNRGRELEGWALNGQLRTTLEKKIACNFYLVKSPNPKRNPASWTLPSPARLHCAHKQPVQIPRGYKSIIYWTRRNSGVFPPPEGGRFHLFADWGRGSCFCLRISCLKSFGPCRHNQLGWYILLITVWIHILTEATISHQCQLSI